jgi:large repetitive protein
VHIYYLDKGQASINVEFTCDAITGSISVKSVDECGNTSIARSQTVTISTSLANLGIISGTTSPYFGQEGVSYSVAPITGANTYSWSVPEGAVVSSGQGTANIAVDFSCCSN